MHSQTILRTALWASLGAWLGAWAFFAFVVSRIAFQILPGELAGNLVGALLTILHFGGAAAALVAAGAAVSLGRRGWLLALPVALALICLFNELWIRPEIASLRPSAIGEVSTAEIAARFRWLHRLSIGLFLSVWFAVLVLVVGHARCDSRDARVNG